MAESTGARGGRRMRRSARVSQRLQHARERNAAQLATQREREQRVEDALTDFVEAGELLAREDAACAERIAVLQRKIEQTQVASRERVAGEHARQARAALTIHEAGRNAAQVAELLQLRSEKEARQLITAGREAARLDAGADQESPSAVDVVTAESEPAGDQTTECVMSAECTGTGEAGALSPAHESVEPAPVEHGATGS